MNFIRIEWKRSDRSGCLATSSQWNDHNSSICFLWFERIFNHQHSQWRISKEPRHQRNWISRKFRSRIIESGSFSSSSLEKLSLPKSIEKLEDGWNGYLSLKFGITIPQRNPYFQYYNNQLLVVQSTEENKNVFDSIIFVNRCIQKVEIPSFIRKICSFAFSRCKNLISINFSDDSNLCEIGNYAFYQSSILHAVIPRKTSEIGQYAFHECIKLVSIEKFNLNSVTAVFITTINWNWFRVQMRSAYPLINSSAVIKICHFFWLQVLSIRNYK